LTTAAETGQREFPSIDDHESGHDAPGDVPAIRSRAHRDSLLDSLERLAPELEAEVEKNEAEYVLSDRTLELLRQTRIPQLLLSESAGGLGMFPTDALPVLERLAQIDATIGWVGGNWSTAGLLLAYFEPGAVSRLLEDGQPLFAVTSSPTGRAVPVDGGYLVTGNWQYGTGVKQADWVMCSAVPVGEDGTLLTDPGGNPVLRFFAVRGSEIERKGNWDTLGLRGTGSIDLGVTDVFVPHDFVMDFLAPPATKERQSSGGFMVLLSVLHTTFALGASRRLLDEIEKHANRPSSRGSILADNPVFRTEVARQEVAVRSARAFVYEAWKTLDARLKVSEQPTLRDITMLRASMVHIHDVTREVALFAFAKSMGTGLRSGTLQRLVRDALSGCQHLIAQDAIYPDVAMDLMGTAPASAVWAPYGIIDLGNNHG
jgi:alkylation response protein AidB-like acyl-CoA dehydrogenase